MMAPLTTLSSYPTSLSRAYTASYHAIVKREDTHVSAMVNMTAPDDGVCVVLDPDTSQRIATDLIVQVKTLMYKEW